MYEMYPDTWAAAEAASTSSAPAKPRRRERKEHSVLPPVVVHQTAPVKPEPAAD